jgi:hypothetical protein
MSAEPRVSDQGHQGYDRWLVVLSDSVDLDPDYMNLGAQVANQIRQMSQSGLNLAFINSEKISGEKHSLASHTHSLASPTRWLQGTRETP